MFFAEIPVPLVLTEYVSRKRFTAKTAGNKGPHENRLEIARNPEFCDIPLSLQVPGLEVHFPRSLMDVPVPGR